MAGSKTRLDIYVCIKFCIKPTFDRFKLIIFFLTKPAEQTFLAQLFAAKSFPLDIEITYENPDGTTGSTIQTFDSLQQLRTSEVGYSTNGLQVNEMKKHKPK
jgi:hypothetical protein